MTDLITFSLFSQLPFELRSEIWTLTLPVAEEPRLIDVDVGSDRFHKDGNLHVARSNEPHMSHIACGFNPWISKHNPPSQAQKKKLPSALHICRESRKIAQTRCDWCFTTAARKEYVFTIKPRPHEVGFKSARVVDGKEVLTQGILFNPTRDTIHIAGWALTLLLALSNARAEELKTENIRSLAVMIGLYNLEPDLFWGGKARDGGGEGGLFGGLFEGLEELIVVAMEDKQGGEGRKTGKRMAKESIREDVERRIRENQGRRVPVVRVMTNRELSASMGKRSLWEGRGGYRDDFHL